MFRNVNRLGLVFMCHVPKRSFDGPFPSCLFRVCKPLTVFQNNTAGSFQGNISVPVTKKRPLRKKRIISDELSEKKGFKNVVAFSTAEEYDLEKLIAGLKIQDLYIPTQFDSESSSDTEVVQATAKYQVSEEPREIFFFREGSLVLWNIPEVEIDNLLFYLKDFEMGSYDSELVHEEVELMKYITSDISKSKLEDGNFILSAQNDHKYEKYTFSNAMALSVKLGTWEASLDRYIESMEQVTQDLKMGRKIKMSQEEVFRKTGELFALRHSINLSSDLLDTPDFYWDREELEHLYQQTCGCLSVSKRTRVMNEKLNHCVELVELLSSHLSDKHHIRLEWMIIVLIMVEVGFEILHYIERFYEPQTHQQYNNIVQYN